MIVKEHEAASTNDRLRRAGNEAEKQMAFYLRRAFGSDPDVFVFNNLRLEHEGEVGQIDHLILHKGGMVIVESKSVTSAVRINDREEWTRQWNGRWQGMASPVLQARRQADVLRDVLQAHREQLLNKMMFGQQRGFRAFVIDVLVAISDSGVIEAKGDRPEVRKADQVPEQIKALMREHASLANPLSLRFDRRAMQEGFNLAPDKLTRTVTFLRNHHVEAVAPAEAVSSTEEAALAPQVQESRQEAIHLKPAPSQAEPVQARLAALQATLAKPAPAGRVFKCSKCQRPHLQIQFGKSYYFKCLDCGGNTAIHLTCSQCGSPARTRKSGKEFYAECQNGHSELYFVNP